MQTPIQVLKFGGSSVGSGERMRRVAHIIARALHNSEEAFPVVVVSAMSGTTDQLIRIVIHTCKGENDAALQNFQALKKRHEEALEQAVHTNEGRNVLQRDLANALEGLEQDIAALEDVAAQFIVPNSSGDHDAEPKELRPYIDAVVSWGERLSVRLVAAAARDLDIAAAAVDKELIITKVPDCDAPQPLGSMVGADPLPVETQANAQAIIYPFIEQQVVPIAAGFIGRTIENSNSFTQDNRGVVTTLGRNGSDYSATVIGAALDCIEVTIYTDVDGVLTADPRSVASARLLPRLSYAEAARLSWFGAKVLHPRTLMPIADRNIPVRVRNTFRPHTRGTVVGPEGTQRSDARSITVHHNLALITVKRKDLFGAPESAGQVFALAARAWASPIVICSSSGHHLSFMVEEHVVESILALLQHDMGEWTVDCQRSLAVCACLGSGFTADPLSPARATSTLAREHIPLITQGASDLGMTLIVEDHDSERALHSLHRDLIAPVIPLTRHSGRKLYAAEMPKLSKRGHKVGSLGQTCP